MVNYPLISRALHRLLYNCSAIGQDIYYIDFKQVGSGAGERI